MPLQRDNGANRVPLNASPALGRDHIGRYEIMYPIAMGGMAGVHAGRLVGQGGFEKLVAIKVIHPHLSSERSFVEMFLDEARLAARLQHPNIGEVYEIGEEDGLLYMVVELIMGQDLSALFRRVLPRLGQIDPSYAALIAKDVCGALQEAHELRDDAGRPLNLVHRDVTPRNILVSYKGQVKLIDFGVAFARDRLTSTAVGLTKGKIGFMPPEQIRGPVVDRRADIFSLGVTLYWMVTGEHPFPGNTDAVRIQRILSGKVKPPTQCRPDLPPALEAVILKALAPRPVDRFETAAQMGDALTPLVPGGYGGGGNEALGDLVFELFEEEHDEQLRRIRQHRDRGSAVNAGNGREGSGSGSDSGASNGSHGGARDQSAIPVSLESGSVLTGKERSRLAWWGGVMAGAFGFVVGILGLVFALGDNSKVETFLEEGEATLQGAGFLVDDIRSTAPDLSTSPGEDDKESDSVEVPEKDSAKIVKADSAGEDVLDFTQDTDLNPEAVLQEPAATDSEEAAKGDSQQMWVKRKGAKWTAPGASKNQGAGASGAIAGGGPEASDDKEAGRTLSIKLTVSVPDAGISVDGKFMGDGAYSFDLPADGKRHVLDISAKGYKKKSIHFKADVDKEIFVHLEEDETIESSPPEVSPSKSNKRVSTPKKKASDESDEPKLKSSPY